MAVHRARVIGQLEVGGVKPGGTVELDEEVVNLGVLIDGELIELITEKPKADAPKRQQKKGGDV